MFAWPVLRCPRRRHGMGSSTTGQSSGLGGRILGEVRLLLGLIFRFVDGFRTSSWDAAAEAGVAEDLERLEKLDLPARAKTAVEAETVRLLRRRHELLREQARLSQVGTRLIGVLGVVTVVGAPILNMVLFRVDGERFLPAFFEDLMLLAVAWLLISLPLPLLRLARPRGSWLWLGWVAAGVSAFAAALWTLYWQVASGSPLTRLSADSATGLAAIAAALLAAVALMVGLLVWSSWKVWIDVGLRRQWETGNPQVAVVRGLAVVLSILYGLRRGTSTGKYSAIEVTGVLWGTLEATSEAVDSGMGAVLDHRSSFKTETRHLVARISAGLRALKEGVSVRGPLREDGRPVVDADGLARAESAFLAWAGGGVDDLPRGEPGPPLPAARRRGAPQQVAAALAPLVILLLARIAHLDLGSFGSLLVAIAIAWLISGLLYALLGDDLEAYAARASSWGKILGSSGSSSDSAGRSPGAGDSHPSGRSGAGSRSESS